MVGKEVRRTLQGEECPRTTRSVSFGGNPWITWDKMRMRLPVVANACSSWSDVDEYDKILWVHSVQISVATSYEKIMETLY